MYMSSGQDLGHTCEVSVRLEHVQRIFNEKRKKNFSGWWRFETTPQPHPLAKPQSSHRDKFVLCWHTKIEVNLSERLAKFQRQAKLHKFQNGQKWCQIKFLCVQTYSTCNSRKTWQSRWGVLGWGALGLFTHVHPLKNYIFLAHEEWDKKTRRILRNTKGLFPPLCALGRSSYTIAHSLSHT